MAAYPPSVDSIVRRVDDGSLPRPLLVETVRQVIDDSRRDPTIEVETEVRRRVQLLGRSQIRRVINATGVLLHTNLGRAPLSPAAAAAGADIAAGYANVELDLASGERGRRNESVNRLLTALTGAEAATVVNNNAGAVFLALSALARGRRVPVSRGELIEIGGSYRLPELMAAAGVDLVEVGTTNRTRLGDYSAVESPALFLKVHPSNYRVVGFSEATDLSELAKLAREREVPLVYDVGSGLLDTATPWLGGPPPPWLADEPGVRQSLAAGADLVLFSGDKLLGGPQAGIIVGRAALVHRLTRHPAARALRLDGATAAALSATLESYLRGSAADLPLWRMARLSPDEIRGRASEVLAGVEGRLVDGFSTVGAGSAPGAEIPTVLIELEDADATYLRLLHADPPILARRQSGRLLIDLRTVDPCDDEHVAAALRAR